MWGVDLPSLVEWGSDAPGRKQHLTPDMKLTPGLKVEAIGAWGENSKLDARQ